MASDTDSHSAKGRRTSTQGGGAVFWLLVLMGLSTFAPCVILPEWRDYERLRVAEQAQRHELDTLEKRVEDERRMLDAMRGDPAVIGRFAQRDLSFRRIGERVVHVSVPMAASTHMATSVPFAPEPVRPPAFLQPVLSRLPNLDYDAVFCDDETRLIVMVMSVSLIGIAFGLFSGRRTVDPRVG